LAIDPFMRGPMGLNRQISSAAIHTNIGSHVDRRQRYDARARRRDGDWSVLGVPTALLWLEEEDVLEQELEWPLGI